MTGPQAQKSRTIQVNYNFRAGQGTEAPNPGLFQEFQDSWQLSIYLSKLTLTHTIAFAWRFIFDTSTHENHTKLQTGPSLKVKWWYKLPTLVCSYQSLRSCMVRNTVLYVWILLRLSRSAPDSPLNRQASTFSDYPVSCQNSTHTKIYQQFQLYLLPLLHATSRLKAAQKLLACNQLHEKLQCMFTLSVIPPPNFLSLV